MNIFSDLTKSIDGFDTSRQLALGMAIGAMIGLIPKDNLIFLALLVMLILSGANFVTGAVSTLVLTLVQNLLQPVLSKLGEVLLNLEWLVASLTNFYEFPFATWTRLDNTVVIGSFATSILAFVPVYLASFYLFEKYKDNIRHRLTESSLSKWIVGYEPVEIRDE